MSTTAASYMDSWTLVASSLKIVRNVLPPLGMKRACATYMPTTATGENAQKGARSSYMEKEQPASRRWPHHHHHHHHRQQQQQQQPQPQPQIKHKQQQQQEEEQDQEGKPANISNISSRRTYGPMDGKTRTDKHHWNVTPPAAPPHQHVWIAKYCHQSPFFGWKRCK